MADDRDIVVRLRAPKIFAGPAQTFADAVVTSGQVRAKRGLSRLAVLGAVLMCSGCGFTLPVVVITAAGQTLRGSATASMAGGSFTATDGKLTCAGSYDSMETSRTITMPVLCSDGRKGIVISTRDTDRSGHGTVRLNDGSEAQFIFGKAAENF